MKANRMHLICAPGSVYTHMIKYKVNITTSASVFTTRHRPWRGALVVEGGDPDPRAGKKGEILCGDSVRMRVFRSAWPG